VSDAHDLDELAVREVSEWRALGEVLLGFDAAPKLVGCLADDPNVSRETGLRSAVLGSHAGDANHGDDVESHEDVLLLRGVFAVEGVWEAVIPLASRVST
jgi:hypothetical protein